MPIDFTLRDFCYPLSIYRLRRTFERTQWLSLGELAAYQNQRLAVVIGSSQCGLLDCSGVRSGTVRRLTIPFRNRYREGIHGQEFSRPIIHDSGSESQPAGQLSQIWRRVLSVMTFPRQFSTSISRQLRPAWFNFLIDREKSSRYTPRQNHRRSEQWFSGSS